MNKFNISMLCTKIMCIALENQDNILEKYTEYQKSQYIFDAAKDIRKYIVDILHKDHFNVDYNYIENLLTIIEVENQYLQRLCQNYTDEEDNVNVFKITQSNCDLIRDLIYH